MKLFFLLPLALLLAACQDSEQPFLDVSEAPSVNAGQSFGIVEGRDLNAYPSDQRLAIQQQLTAIEMDMVQRFETAPSAAVAERRAAELLDSVENKLVLSYARETAAFEILRRWPETRSEDDLDLVGRQVSVLVEANSPEADLIAQGLDHLQARWPASQVKHAAQSALRAADTACVTCGDDGAPSAEALPNAMSATIAQQQSKNRAGMFRLRELASDAQ